jgi:hypothetical protein
MEVSVGQSVSLCAYIVFVVGQHLITAIIDKNYGYKTLSWYVSKRFRDFPNTTTPQPLGNTVEFRFLERIFID